MNTSQVYSPAQSLLQYCSSLYPQTGISSSYSIPSSTTASGSSSSPIIQSADSRGFISQIASIAYEIAQSVVQSVLEFFSPLLGNYIQTSAGLPVQDAYGSAAASGILSNGIFPYATATKKPETFFDKLIAWFKVAGDFGHDISNGLKDGRDMLNPISDGLSWGWDKAKELVGGFGEKIGSFFGSIF